MTAEVTTVVVLVLLQLLVLRVSQHAMPSLYFTTSSLFSRREDVAGKAVVFRLVIPLLAGAASSLLLGGYHADVAAIAGAAAWFLILWPIMWNPKIVDRPLHAGFLGVLFVFWAAYALLPVAGAAGATWLADTLDTSATEWKTQFAWSLPTGAVFSVLTWAITRAWGARVSFANDPAPRSIPVVEDGPPPQRSLRTRATFWMKYESSQWASALVLVSAVVWIFSGVRRARR